MSELNVDELIDVRRAMEILDAETVEPKIRTTFLEDIDEQVLAQDIIADRDYPPFDKSLVDGFAVRSSDLTTLPATLKLVGEVAAGQSLDGSIEAGEAVAIMTGAPIPAGADRVVPVEKTRVEGDRVIILEASTSTSIHKQGCEARKGDVVIPKGVRCDSRHLAAIAQVGLSDVDVYEMPRVAVVVTGDEVVGAGDEVGPNQIRDANAPMFDVLLFKLGAAPVETTHAPDSLNRIKKTISRVLDENRDAVVITGGISMGKFDFVPQALTELGFELKIRKLKMRPGKPFVFGVRMYNGRKQFAFGLPGNPVSAYVCTVMLASRLLDRMAGLKLPTDRTRRFILESDLPANGPREFYQPALVNGRTLKPLNWIGSADVFTLARADVLLIRPSNDPARQTGDEVMAIEIPR
ncbi:MAG TPA: molybdopterin molybdotransferase MoeA [Tepidisphaeraceae bacterium]|nr:molybdopterin molybdotransferase MoeA [Tepidisphaeraceae bacterium]